MKLHMKELEPGFHSVYSEKHNDLVGFALISPKTDRIDQAFVFTFPTDKNTASKKIALVDNLIVFHNSEFGSIKFRVDNPQAFAELLDGELVEQYEGTKDGTTPRIAFLKKWS